MPSQYVDSIARNAQYLEKFDAADTANAILFLNEDDLRHVRDKPQLYEPCIERVRRVLAYLSGRAEFARDKDGAKGFIGFTEKDEIIKLILACTIAQVPMVLLGDPGTAKSAMVRTFCETLGLRARHEKIGPFEAILRKRMREMKTGKEGPETLQSQDDDAEARQNLRVGQRPLFEYLVTRYTTPEEILGPANIDAMLSLSMYYRESEGMLPNAQIAFLDEIFKANSAILNALLSIINERIYYNAARAFDVDLMTVFGASNEAPDTEELAALYDRFPIRAVSNPVTDQGAEKLLQSSEEMAYRRGVAPARPPKDDRASQPEKAGDGLAIEKIACVNDFRLLSRLSYVTFGNNGRTFGGAGAPAGRSGFAEEFKSMFCTLREEFGISDRTPERLLRVSRALALLDGDTELTKKHLAVFKYCAPDADSARVLADVVEETIAGIV